MKGISAFLLSLGLLLAAGMLFATHRSLAAPVSSKTTVKWEYKLISGEDLVNDQGDSNKAFLDAMNKFGDEGWELASLGNGYLVFKRPK